MKAYAIWSSFCGKKFRSMYAVGIAQGILATILGTTDGLLAGYFCGESAVSAIGLTAPISAFLFFVVMAFSQGCRLIYSEEIGRFDIRKAGDYFSTAMTTVVALTAVFLAMMAMAGDSYFSLYTLSGDTLRFAKEYFSFNKYVYVLTPLVTFIGQMVFCDGDEKICTIATVFNFVANIVISVIGAATMGMAGIGLGTLLSCVGCLAIYCVHFFRKNNTLKYRLHFSFQELWRLTRYSFLDSSFFLFQSVTGVLINQFILNRFGQEFMSAYSVVVFVLGFSGLFTAISEAMLPILNTYRGENNRDGVIKILRVTSHATIGMGLLMSVLLFVTAPLFPGIFSITSPALRAASTSGIRIVSLTYVFISIMTVLPAYYNAYGKVILSMVIARCKDSIFYMVFLWLFGSLMGVNGMWIGIMLSPVAAFLLTLFLGARLFGRKNIILLPEHDRTIRSWDLELSPESIHRLQNESEAFLKDNVVPEKTIRRAMLLEEEVLHLVLEKNGNTGERKRITAEVTLLLGEDLEIIFRDNGKIFDTTDEDMKLTSFRAYVISSFGRVIREKSHTTSVAFNRSRFLLPMGEET